jgi:phage terminase large subunit
MTVQPTYQVRYNKRDGLRFYGGNREAFYSHAPEFILAGGAESGKTFALCWKYHLLALKYPGARGLIVRKTQKSVYPSVLRTWERVVKGAPIEIFGGSRPETYNYQNGSAVWVGGLDNADKVLSSEWDWIYINQAEELTLDDYEKLLTRATGRGAVMPYTQVGGDCNPAGRLHWIRERAQAGKLALITSTIKDNPTLYDPGTGAITDQGRRTLATLESLTGVRRKRLLEGIWATAEGAVYGTFDPVAHVREQDLLTLSRWMIACDEGYTNPAVLLLIGIDADGRLHIAREFYRRGVLQSAVVAECAAWCNERQVDGVIIDQAAAGLIADMRDAGLPAVGHKGRVLDGIQQVQNLLRVAGDGRPRLTVDPACVETINEFESYAWKPERDEPIKENDHAMDALRYLVSSISGDNWYMS